MAETCFICGVPRPAGEDCPRCGAPADIAEAAPRHRADRRTRLVRGLVAGGALACVVAWALLTGVDVESVMVTGPVLTLLGVALIIAGWRWRNRWAVRVGAGHVGMCVLFVALVNLWGWGPSQAQGPFALMGLIYLVAVAAPTVFAWKLAAPAPNPWLCSACGYLLVGIREPRCPECGEPVDAVIFERIRELQRRASGEPEPLPVPAPLPGPPSLFAAGSSTLLP